MHANSHPRWPILTIVSTLLLSACSPAAGMPPPADTIPAASPTAMQQATPAATDEPHCRILQDEFVRSGPGKAYDPPTGSLLANTVVIPLAYQPVGSPSGSWVQVEDPVGNTKGWVGAGPHDISCNLDLTTLPEGIAAAPTAPTATSAPVAQVPHRPHAKGSNPEGTCGQGGIPGQKGTYDCSVDFLDGFPFQFHITRDGVEIGKADGVLNVEFDVTDKNGSPVYKQVEKNEPYCIFGGGDVCPSWTLENNVYKWRSGGKIVRPGTYNVSINATTDDPDEPLNIHWAEDVKITLP